LEMLGSKTIRRVVERLPPLRSHCQFAATLPIYNPSAPHEFH
jgi:hypothetical protein